MTVLKVILPDFKFSSFRKPYQHSYYPYVCPKPSQHFYQGIVYCTCCVICAVYYSTRLALLFMGLCNSRECVKFMPAVLVREGNTAVVFAGCILYNHSKVNCYNYVLPIVYLL